MMEEEHPPLASGVLVAEPVPASKTQVNVVVQPTAPETPLLYSDSGYLLPPEPRGRWRDGLCDCCNEMGICCCMFWCNGTSWGSYGFGFIPVGQLYERVMQKGGYAILVAAYAFFWLISFILYQVGSAKGGAGAHEFQAANQIMGWTHFGLFLLVLLIRQRVRHLYRISPACCGDCEDCCCAWWCFPCTLCQIWRHVQDPVSSGAIGCCGCTSKDGLPASFNTRSQKAVWYPNRQSVISGAANAANMV